MTFLVPLMLIGWVPFTIILFFLVKPHKAVVISIIGGWLFLPVAGFNLPGLPDYSKSMAISLGLVIGSLLSGAGAKSEFRWNAYDIPMLLWCISPFITSLTNNLGIYNGLSGLTSQIVLWGVPYYSGRIFFTTEESIRDLCVGILIGGTIYTLLCLWEIRMSPRLSINIYGFFPHEWRQHGRYGGWRPIVFMQHGLMVALWMAATTTVAFWLWRSRNLRYLFSLPVSILFGVMAVTTVLCKTASGWLALAIGCCCYFFYRDKGRNRLIRLFFLAVPLYMIFRILGIISSETVLSLASFIFDAERAGSFGIRLLQEDLFIERVMERAVFGWGGYGRNNPVNFETGEEAIKAVDALWVIVLSKQGIFGLASYTASMIVGPWLVLNSMKSVKLFTEENYYVYPAVLSIVLLLFMIDSLANGMINPVYILASGVLLTYGLSAKWTQQQNNNSRRQ